jgi:hypothetical protein
MIRAFLPLLSEPQHELALLHLCEPAVHKQFRSRDVAAVVGREKHHRLRDLVGRPKSHQSLSDCEDDPAEGAALNQVTQSISRFGQWEGLSYDRFDGAGLKQRDDSIPGVNPGRLRLSEEYEALDAGLLPDQICDVDGCLAVCRITQCCEASAYSGPNRPPIPMQIGHPFRSKPATVPEHSGHALQRDLGRSH